MSCPLLVIDAKIIVLNSNNLIFCIVVLKIFFIFVIMPGKTKDITPLQYSKFKKCSLANITKHIRNGNALKLPYVISLKNISRFYLLEVPESLTNDTFTDDIIKYNKK